MIKKHGNHKSLQGNRNASKTEGATLQRVSGRIEQRHIDTVNWYPGGTFSEKLRNALDALERYR